MCHSFLVLLMPMPPILTGLGRRLGRLLAPGAKPNQNQEQNAGAQSHNKCPSQMALMPSHPGKKDDDYQTNDHDCQKGSFARHGPVSSTDNPSTQGVTARTHAFLQVIRFSRLVVELRLSEPQSHNEPAAFKRLDLPHAS